MVGDPELAEGVVEHAFAALSSAPRLAARGTSARTRILTLVHRRAVELVRGTERSPRTRPALEADTHGQADGRLGAERVRIRRALAQLPEGQRELLVLAYYDGLDVAGLGARLGRPVEAVEDNLRAALHGFQDALADAAAPREVPVPEAPGPASEPRRAPPFGILAQSTERAAEGSLLDHRLDHGLDAGLDRGDRV